MEEKDPIGEQLKSLRKERKVSVPSLAKILLIPKDRIYKWEQGSAPKYQDRQILDKWIKDGKWKNVPHGTKDHHMVNSTGEHDPGYSKDDAGDKPRTFISYRADDPVAAQIIFNLSESSREHAVADRIRADAEILREQNSKRMIDMMVTENESAEIPTNVEARFSDLLELIAELGAGTRWKSKKEGLAVLSKLWHGKKEVSSKAGIRNG